MKVPLLAGEVVTIGPVEQRNIWGYHQTAGLGYFEYFQFCEDIGAKPVPVLPAAVSCQNTGGTWRIGGTGQKAIEMEGMQEYITEVLNLIEWANGPATSTWGAKRAAAGHPAPFNLEYIGIGNEAKITPEFDIKSSLGGNCRIRSYFPLTGKGLTEAKGQNTNPFYKTPDIGKPIINYKELKSQSVSMRKVYEYDLSTKKGEFFD